MWDDEKHLLKLDSFPCGRVTGDGALKIRVIQEVRFNNSIDDIKVFPSI